MKSSSLQPVKEPRLTVDSRDKFALRMCSMLGVPTLTFSLDCRVSWVRITPIAALSLPWSRDIIACLHVCRCVCLRPRSTANPQFSGEGSGTAGPADGVTGGHADSSPV